ncbi:MAG: hypothetical protein IT158_11920 [Bryobacterales bacterium]|nr:hypothetical protein [Bryobacterales bacterium]
MTVYVILSLALALYCLLVYLLGSVLGLEGSSAWILRGLLMLIGLLAAVAYLWHYLRVLKPARESAGGTEPGGDAGGEAGALLREAEAKLAAAAQGGRNRVANLPVLLILGRQGAAKTSTVVQCGAGPELLAGQLYRDNNIAPTPAANLWFAQRSVFVESGGRLLAQEADWLRLLKKLRPGTLGSVFGAGQDAPRAALVCVSCEEFLQPGAEDSLAAAARDLRAKLEQASQAMGVRLPVYVLFTKTDRLAFFAEYVRHLDANEAGQVLGSTLPAPGEGNGVYAERQTALLTQRFNDLIYSLSDWRPRLLLRAQEDAGLSEIYEFPRELRKLRSSLVQFLVDLCRPSQLQAGPFLRGFYFSGVRAVVTREMPQAPRVAEHGAGEVSQATSVFRAGQAAAAGASPPAPVVRRKPQWIFLAHLFQDILLRDGLAGGGGVSVQTNRLRRALLAAAAVLCLVWMIGMAVSYSGNRGLESRTLEAVRGIGATEAAGGELASLDALNRLETLRQSLETLTRYKLEGAPYRLRWGLYTGGRLYPVVRRAYYSRFHRLLFASTQGSLIGTLQRLPDKPSPADPYGPVYDTLKAHLITTSHPDKSSREFLTPVLMSHWIGSRQVDEPRAGLARKQFDFYAADLLVSNPFSSQEDRTGVGRGRAYLAQFAGAERVYQAMIAEASRRNDPINFNRMFPGSSAVVVNNREVPGAFSKDGWTFMQTAMQNPERFFGGEEWVLGRQSSAGIDKAALAGQLAARYRKDFIDQWRAYLADTAVVRYRNLPDAAAKLKTLSGNQSPLLAALWLASRNTAVGSEEIRKIFQPVQYVTPPEIQDRYIAGSNTGYMQALLGLQASVEQAAGAPAAGRDAFIGPLNAQASQAKLVTRQVAQNFTINPGTKVETQVQDLMEKPILYAEALAGALGPAELNSKGQALCAQFRSVARKYPFRSDASEEATLAEVGGLFAPGTGAIWTFYEENLREHLTRQGARFVPNPAGKIQLDPAFVNFLNRAAAFTDALYPGGSREARLTYQLTGHPAEGIRSVRLSVDNVSLNVTSGPQTATFQWPGSGNQQVSLAGQFGGDPALTFTSYQGLWAVFRFFGEADRWQAAGNLDRLEWVPRQGRAARPLTLPDGRPLTVRYDLQAPAPVFRKDFLAGLACAPRVAR